MTPTTSGPIGVYATPDQADQIDQQFNQAADTNQQYNDFADMVREHMLEQQDQWARFQQMAADHAAGLQDDYARFVDMARGFANQSNGATSQPAPNGGTGANPDALSAIVGKAKQYGVDPALALATAMHESGLNPRAVGDNGTSFGLYQLHQGGELGNMSADQAYDPATNADTALSTMAQFAAQNPQLSGGALAAAAQRPANPQAYAAAVDALLPRAQAMLGQSQQGPGSFAEQDVAGLLANMGRPVDASLPNPSGVDGVQPDAGPSPSDQQTPIAQYNQRAGGDFQQVTKMASGDYNVQPTAAPSADEQAVYDAQNAATGGFTSPMENVPLQAGSAPGAQTAQPEMTPQAQAATDAYRQAQAPPVAAQEAHASPGSDLIGPAPSPDASAPEDQGVNPVTGEPVSINWGGVANLFHQLGDALTGAPGRFAAGAQQAAERDAGTNLAGTEGIGDIVNKAGDVVVGGIAGALGAPPSPSLPPDAIAPGKLEDPYTNTGLSKVPVVGGLISAALNPANYIPIGGEAVAGEDALKAVAAAAGDFARSDAARSMPVMAGGAVSSGAPSLLERVQSVLGGKSQAGATLPPDVLANRTANAIQQFMSSPNLAGVRNVRGAVTMNGAAKASWDLAGDMLGNAVEQALPDAATRDRIVAEFNDPAARATWTPDMQYWADYWTKAEQNTSQIAKATGVIQNMLPDYMARLARKPDGSPVEASAFSDYVGAAKQRTLPTYQDFVTAIQAKGFEPVTDLADVMRAKVSSLGNAIENSRLGTALEVMPAADGNPVLLPQKAIGRTFGKDGAEGSIILGNRTQPGYTSVHIPGMGDRMVNDTAVADLRDVIKPPIDNPVYQALVNMNRGIQWGIMYNPLIHSRNVLTPAMAGSGGFDALAAGIPVWKQGMDVVHAQPEDLLELVRGGLSMTANRQARQAAIDAMVASSPDAGLSALGAKIPARAGLDHLLWDGIVQPLQVGTAVRLRDQFLKQGLSRDDAVRAAAETANTMFGQLPAATLSNVQRQAGSLLLFAKNWTFGNLRVLRYASYDLPGHGLAARVGLDRPVAAAGSALNNVSPVASHLTPEAEAAVANAARAYLARAFVQGAVAHAAMNYALTGHSQFENAPGHELDLAWRDDRGVEHYSAYPFYKQMQDYLGYAGAFGKSPVRTALNRAAPTASTAFEAGEPFLNARDAGKDGPLLHALKVGLHNLAPFGVGNFVDPNPTRQEPAQPLSLDVLGASAKTESAGSSRGATRPTPPRVAVRR